MSRTRLLFSLGVIAASLSLSCSIAHAKVYVSDELAYDTPVQSLVVKPNQMVWYPLPSLSSNESLRVHFIVNNKAFSDISVAVCDTPNLNALKNGQSYRCFHADRVKRGGDLEASIYGVGQHFVAFDNRYAGFISKSVSFNETVQYEVDPRRREMLQDMFQKFYLTTKRMFNFRDFNINVKACGFANASSDARTGDITMCSELLLPMILGKQLGAIAGSAYHELGHTLLGEWKLPGNDNERTADEFAVVMMFLTNSQHLIYEWTNWFQVRANTHLTGELNGALSGVQRVAAIQEILNNPGPVIQRWLTILYPHMTDEALEQAARGSVSLQTSPSLARQILDDRRAQAELRN